MLPLNILPSPAQDVIIQPYDEIAFPTFSSFLAGLSPSSLLRGIVCEPIKSRAAIILENRSSKAITGLRCRWVMTDTSGKNRTHTVSSDSYFLDAYRPVANPGSRHLISPFGSMDESLISHVLAGGGLIGGNISSSADSLADVVDLTFEIDFVLFADGEIAGPDPDRYAMELRCRKPAAEFIAKQIRLAAFEGRDIKPVLSALVDMPCLGQRGHATNDPMVLWVKHYAREYLRAMKDKLMPIDMVDVKLRHLENRPTIPNFYRKH